MKKWFSLDGKAIRKWLHRERRKQAFLMDELKTSRATVGRMLDGHVPEDPELVKGVAQLMGVQVDSLLIPKEAKRA